MSNLANQSKEDAELMARAQEIAELFQRAIKLGFSITLQPEHLKLMVALCESIELQKIRR